MNWIIRKGEWQNRKMSIAISVAIAKIENSNFNGKVKNEIITMSIQIRKIKIKN